jgi:hypothetical protein
MPAVAILAPGWIDRASRCVDSTEKAVSGVVRSGCQSHGNWMHKDGRLRRNDRP